MPQNIFPVTNHLHVDPEELIGMPELVTAVENINITLAGMELTVDYDTINAYADSKNTELIVSGCNK